MVATLAAYFAWSIGKRQNEINEALKNIEDSVEVFGYCRLSSDEKTWFFSLMNVGKLQLYLYQYEINSIKTDISDALIPANQQQNAWFNIKLPNVEIGHVVTLKLRLKDQLNRCWLSLVETKYIGVGGWETVVKKINRISDGG